MLKPEEVRGSLPSETEIKEHGVSYYALADEHVRTIFAEGLEHATE